MTTEKHSTFSDSWDDLEKNLKQRARLALVRFEQTRQKIDETMALMKTRSQESAREATHMAVKEAKEVFNSAKTEIMRVSVEGSISDLRHQAESRLTAIYRFFRTTP